MSRLCPIAIEQHYGQLAKVQCYASDLNQAFLNILTNAIDALIAGNIPPPKIAIATQATAQTIIIIISDNGPGIPPEIQSKIFNPFFTTKPLGQGSGLGLTTAHQIVVDQHGGQLFMQAGEGASFVIENPINPTS